MIADVIVSENMDTALVIVIGGIATQLITSFLAWMQSRRNNKHIAAMNSLVESIKSEQVETKHELNSRLTELIESVRVAARAAGILEGIEQQKRRQDNPGPHTNA